MSEPLSRRFIISSTALIAVMGVLIGTFLMTGVSHYLLGQQEYFADFGLVPLFVLAIVLQARRMLTRVA
ncbi:MAG TPA: hypothetical protein VLX44_16950 [Xanthobacteraceae bacterium]|nr:hypothetical protein [Xanthobacteraceae bacterium]